MKGALEHNQKDFPIERAFQSVAAIQIQMKVNLGSCRKWAEPIFFAYAKVTLAQKQVRRLRY